MGAPEEDQPTLLGVVPKERLAGPPAKSPTKVNEPPPAPLPAPRAGKPAIRVRVRPKK